MGPTSAAAPPGAYTLIRVIGRGGNGEVWESVQGSLGRTVAVKRLRDDLLEHARNTDPRVVEALASMFRREALTASFLDHPNMIPIYDLGVDDQGTPLLAMKLVQGKAWSDVLDDDYRMPMVERLARHLPILVSVANAVSFAHARGVIHRDLKPSQVMIGDHGAVYLMDWGLALSCAPDPRMTSDETSTPIVAPTPVEATHPAGTPAYMAPEQIGESGEGLGTWTDIYLLGGILFNILTGDVPHPGNTPERAMFQAGNGEVDRPEDRAPDRDIPADLSATCQRALASDPARRHRSADDFIAEIQAYLTGSGNRTESRRLLEQANAAYPRAGADFERLIECDDLLRRALSLWPGNSDAQQLHARVLLDYVAAARAAGDLRLARAQAMRIEDKEARMHAVKEIEALINRQTVLARQRRLAVLAAAILLIALVITAQRARQSNVAAATAQERAALFTRVNALRVDEAQLATELERTFPGQRSLLANEGSAGANLPEARAEALRVRLSSLKNQRRALAARLPLEPEPYNLALAEADMALAQARKGDDFLAAYSLYDQARRRRPELTQPLVGLGLAAARAGRITSATLALEEATSRTLERLGPNHPEYGRLLALTGEAYQSLDESEEAYRGYYRRSSRVLAGQWERLSLDLGAQWRALGQLEQPLLLTSTTLALALAQDSPEKPATATAYEAYGTCLVDSGRFQEAEQIFAKALALRRKLSGEDSAETAQALEAYGISLNQLARYGEADRYLQRALTIAEKRFGSDAPETAHALSSVAANLDALGRSAEAVPLHKRSLDVRRKTLGANHPLTATSASNLAGSLDEQGKFREAEPLHREALAIRTELMGTDSIPVANANTKLGLNLSSQGRYPEANICLQRALDTYEKRFEHDNPQLIPGYNNLALNLNAMDRRDLSIPLFRRSLELTVKTYGENNPGTARAYNNLGASLRGAGRYAEALPILQHAAAVTSATLGPDHPYTAIALMNTGSCLRLLKKHKQSLDWELASYDIFTRDPKNAKRSLASAFFNVGILLDETGRVDDDGLALLLEACHLQRKTNGDYNPQDYTYYETTLRHLVSTEANRSTYPVLDALVLGATLDKMQRGEARYRRGAAEYLVESRALLTSAVLQLTPPRTDIADRLRRQAIALAEATDLPTTHTLRRTFLAGLAPGPVPPPSLRAPGARSVDSAKLYEWLDQVAPPIDWVLEFPAIAGGFDTLAPPREELERRANAILGAELEKWRSDPGRQNLGLDRLPPLH